MPDTLIENPILNSPYREPTRHFRFGDEGITNEVVEKCADALRRNCRFLVMARRPHVGFRPGERRLEDYFDDFPVLRELDQQGRLVWYNAATSAPVTRPSAPAAAGR